MSNLFVDNVTIRSVERPGGYDRYGQPLQNTVPTALRIRARLERRTNRVTGVDGKTTTVDGTIMVAGRTEFVEGDKLTMEDDSQWEVFSVDESYDIRGNVLFRTYNLTKQRVKT